MKTIIYCLTILMAAAIVYSADNPFEEGSYSLGGNIVVRGHTGDAYRSHVVYTLSPNFAKILDNGVFYGAAIYMDYNTRNQNLTYAVGPVIGYYLISNSNEQNIKGKPLLYFEVYGSYGKGKPFNYIYDDVTRYSIGVSLGSIIMLSKSVGVEMRTDYRHDIYKLIGQNITGYNMNIGFGIKSFIF